MYFLAAAETDIGVEKATNQDSVCVKIAATDYGQLALAIVCDGMGGLEKGELASATVINEFISWFENEMPEYLNNFSWDVVGEKWTHMIKKLNRSIGDYGRSCGITLGTTVSAMLMFGDEMLIAHVGDSRIYEVTGRLTQLTIDHSVVGRDVQLGKLTEAEAELDPRRNVLLQCVGASKSVNPQIVKRKITNNANYLICSDGFRHVISPAEIFDAINPQNAGTDAEMSAALRKLIDTVMSRGEEDNISALLINARS